MPIRMGEDQAAVMHRPVVAGVRPRVALVEVNVVDAVQTIGIPEIDVDRLVQVAVEPFPERVHLAAGILAMLQIQPEQVL